MKYILLALLICSPWTGSAQGLLGRIKDKAKSVAEQRAINKAGEVVSKSLDKAEGKITESAARPENNKPENNQPVSDNGETKKEIVAEETTPAIQHFSRYDFVPGELVLYAEDFEGEAKGELPTGWNSNGKGEVVTLNSFSGDWLHVFQKNIYLSDNTKSFGENFTVEFDVLMQFNYDGHQLPYFSFGLFASGDQSNTHNDFLLQYNYNSSAEVFLYPAPKGYSKVQFHSFEKGKYFLRGDDKPVQSFDKTFGKLTHVAVQVQKERLRMWINDEKVYDLPKAVAITHPLNQLFFKIHQSSYTDDKYGIYISNIKVATGKPDTRHKLVEEGKFSTTGILFDVNSDRIKPESGGVLKEVAEVLKKFPDIKVRILGHTDADGSDAANLSLSQKRAAAVKLALVNDFGIETERIQTGGKGETQPVGDNKTKEGRTQNRRVEFIKL